MQDIELLDLHNRMDCFSSDLSYLFWFAVLNMVVVLGCVVVLIWR